MQQLPPPWPCAIWRLLTRCTLPFVRLFCFVQLREEVAEELGIDITPFKAQIKQIATEYVASQ